MWTWWVWTGSHVDLVGVDLVGVDLVGVGCHFRLKPLLREFFRDLDVTSAPALTLVSDGLLHRVAFSVRVYRITKSKNAEKGKNEGPKMLILDKMGQKRPKNGKKDPLK
jgi:hypothetical protein